MHPHASHDLEPRISRLQRSSYSLDSERLGPSNSSSACSTPTSFASYNSSINAPGGRSQIPPDVQSPVHVVKQIRDAHKQMLALSRNNFAKTPNEHDLFPQSESPGRNGWHIDSDSQHEQRSLGSISELSDTTNQHKPSPLGMYHPVEQSRDTVRELQQQVDRLSRELVTLNHERDRQQHEHFKLRQEQQLHFDDLRQHASTLESQLQDSQSSTEELLSVNNFLDAELTKHKGWLDSSQQTASHYRHLFKQEEHQKEQLAQQLHDTQAQLAETWRESSHMQELVAELKGQTAAAADHQAHVRDLTEANRKLDVSRGHLQEANGELLETNRHLEELNKDLSFQLEGLRSALSDAFQDHEAAQDSLKQQHAQQAAERTQAVAHLTDNVTQLESHVSGLEQQLDQAQYELQQSRGQLASRQETDAYTSDRLTGLSSVNARLEDHISDLQSQLEHAQHQLHQAHDSTQAQQAQQASEAADSLAQLSNTNAQLEEHIARLDSQLRQTQQSSQAQHAQQASEASNQLAQLSTAREQLEAHAFSLDQQLGEAHDQLRFVKEEHQSQLAQQADDHASALSQLADANRHLQAHVSSLDRQVEQSKHELHDVHASHQAQRAEQESSRVAELQEKNTQLEGQFCHANRQTLHSILSFVLLLSLLKCHAYMLSSLEDQRQCSCGACSKATWLASHVVNEWSQATLTKGSTTKHICTGG